MRRIEKQDMRWRCCINRARSVDVYAQRSLGQPPINSDSKVTGRCCINRV
ncbi:MAG: hypothetical protein V3Q69_09865 [Burkholderia sp.]